MALQMERRLAGENVFTGFFWVFFVVRLKDREGKRKERLVRLDLCVSVGK